MKLNKGIEVTLKTNIKMLLKRRVKGDISIFFDCDTLYIDIDTNQDISFRYNVYNIADKVCRGMTSEVIVEYCLKQFKKEILSKFFK